jgi:hypothetical protein
MTLKILIAGEGKNELGSWAADRERSEDPPFEGAIEALLRKVHDGGWEIEEGIPWRTIKDIRVRTRKIAGKQKTVFSRHKDAHNVAAVSLHAREKNCDVLAFVRDRDGRKETQEAIEAGLANEEGNSNALQIIGGVAVEKLESWIIALSGKTRSEDRGRKMIDMVFEELDILPKDTGRFVEIISKADLKNLPADATSLRAWLEKAKAVLDET